MAKTIQEVLECEGNRCDGGEWKKCRKCTIKSRGTRDEKILPESEEHKNFVPLGVANSIPDPSESEVEIPVILASIRFPNENGAFPLEEAWI